MRLWLAYAWRDLRSGLQGFWIFLTCLALGTAAIAVVGSLSASIARGLSEQGQPLLGGDVEFAIVHREATPEELAFIAAQGEVGTVAAVRAMALAGEATALVEAKAVDDRYPLYGALALAGGGTLAEALAPRAGAFGLAADDVLAGRLGIGLGSRVKIGDAQFELTALIATEPDRLADGLLFGPRVLMSQEALKATGLIQPGSLITWRYRVKLPQAASLKQAKAVVRQAKKTFPDAGWRVRARDAAAGGAERFIERIAYFMTLVGLTALIAGGAGIANAVSAFVARKARTIATLKCLGARSADVFGIFLTEILLVAWLGIALGLAAGAATPVLAHLALRDVLPLPLTSRVEAVPLLMAAGFGLLVTLAFALWPLSRTRLVSGAGLFRLSVAAPSGRPLLADLAAILASFGLIAGLVYLSFEDARITSYYLAGLVAAFLALLVLARAITWTAARLPKPVSAIWRYGLSNLHRPGSAAVSIILALGLGLTLFVTLALTDATISQELSSSLPRRAPAFYVLDIRNEDRDGFVAQALGSPGVTAVDTAPMLRGRIVKVGTTPAEKVKASPDAAWALRGDRGLTYAEDVPDGSTVVQGRWWPKGYRGPPLVSLVDEIAEGLGLKLGDAVTVNVLGREVTATVASLRRVDWRSLEMNFVMVFSPNALAGAPHHYLATIDMAGGDEAKLLNRLARLYPSVTAVRVKEAIATVSALLGQMLSTIRAANALTLVTGVLVLAGALAAGLSSRLYDAVVLKTYGATRGQLIQAFVVEYAILGAAAALFGIAMGSLGSWFLAFWILEMPWAFSLTTAAATAGLSLVVTIAVGLLATWRALTVKPAPTLRNE